MKEAMKYAVAIAITAAAMLAYMYEAPPEGVVQEVAQEASSQNHPSARPTSSKQTADQTKRELTAAELADIDPASIDWEAMTARFGFFFDPMLMRKHLWASSLNPEEIAAFNKLHVLPFNAKVGENCEPVQIDVEGVPAEHSIIEGCHSVMQLPEHPYTHLPLDQLIDLAETNAEAAVLASRNSEDENLKVSLALRASALSGKSGPLLELATKRFCCPYLTAENAEAAGIDFSVDEVVTRIVLEGIAQKLGDPRARPELWKQIVTDSEHLTTEQAAEILRVAQEAQASSMKNMAEIQAEISGSSQIWELINA